MMHLWHEWRDKVNHIKRLNKERKEANKRILHNIKKELKEARKEKNWGRANGLKTVLSNYHYENSIFDSIPFDARHHFNEYDY